MNGNGSPNSIEENKNKAFVCIYSFIPYVFLLYTMYKLNTILNNVQSKVYILF